MAWLFVALFGAYKSDILHFWLSCVYIEQTVLNCYNETRNLLFIGQKHAQKQVVTVYTNFQV